MRKAEMTQVDYFALATERFGLQCVELSRSPHDVRFGHHGEISVDCTTGQTYTVWPDKGDNITLISAGSLEELNAEAIATAAAAAAAEADYTFGEELDPLPDDEECPESEPATNPPDPVAAAATLAKPDSKAAPAT